MDLRSRTKPKTTSHRARAEETSGTASPMDIRYAAARSYKTVSTTTETAHYSTVFDRISKVERKRAQP